MQSGQNDASVSKQKLPLFRSIRISLRFTREARDAILPKISFGRKNIRKGGKAAERAMSWTHHMTARTESQREIPAKEQGRVGVRKRF